MGAEYNIDMKVKEANVTITLFNNEKKEVFKNANIIFSGANFIRFTTDKNKYITYSGNFKTEKEINN